MVGDRQGRDPWRTRQERRATRTDGKDRYAGGRQDRHADDRQPPPHQVVAVNGFAEGECSAWRLLERGSEHPLAAAIVDGAEERSIKSQSVAAFQSHTGKGVSGTVAGRAVGLGNRPMMADLGIDTASLDTQADELRADAKGSCSSR